MTRYCSLAGRVQVPDPETRIRLAAVRTLARRHCRKGRRIELPYP